MNTTVPQNYFTSMETIAFQENRAFFLDLVKCFKGFKEDVKEFTKSKASIDKYVANSDVEKILSKHTNGNIVLNCDYDDFAYVYPPLIDKSNPLLGTFRQGFGEDLAGNDIKRFTKVLQDKEKNIGWVDLKTGKLHGVYSKMEIAIVVGKAFYTELTPEEMAAVVLHEVGHIITFYTYISTYVVRNYALASVANAVMLQETPERKIEVLRNAKEAFNLDTLDVNTVADSKSSVATHTLLLNAQMETIKSELGTYLYDEIASEYLADQYAARQGAGVHLVTGLDKIMRKYGDPSYIGSVGRIAIAILKLIQFIAVSILTYGIATLFMIVIGFVSHPKFNLYDTTPARYNRVRQQLIQYLKTPKLSKERKERTLSEIKTIDNIMKYVKEYNSLYAIIFTFIVPSHRRESKAMALQKDLENVANNTLFVSATQLKLLA